MAYTLSISFDRGTLDSLGRDSGVLNLRITVDSPTKRPYNRHINSK